MKTGKILLIGGSYFLGRAFTILHMETHALTLLNRGNNPVNSPLVREFHMDRHDTEALKRLPDETFDAVVDFCAYEKGDIETILSALKQTPKRYIMISTADVYERNTGRYMKEEDALESRIFPGEQGAYIAGKVALEKELKTAAEASGMSYTLIRPSIIYGPGNYAPRENLYFQWIRDEGAVYFDPEANGEFQMVYVADVARAIGRLIDEDMEVPILNLCGAEMLTQERFFEALEAATQVSFVRKALTKEEAVAHGVVFPFPQRAEETQYYDAKKAEEMGFSFVSLEEGLAKAYQSFLRR
ncbi:MAG: NAD-dependent epimerase/dehydratase family protein [Lachnospiraceae bacterium]|nr:NAD-dependent epimerase/dehydratase family protein [Lachnospiraceae bacterium]